MKSVFVAAAGWAVFALPAFAEGDPAAGEKAFRGCQACHVVVNDAGEKLAGRNARTGPNLYGIPGRVAGTVDGFKYSKGLIDAGEQGLVWDEASFVAFVQDPTGFMRETLDDGKVRSKMSFRLRKEQEAHDLYAYLLSVSE